MDADLNLKKEGKAILIRGIWKDTIKQLQAIWEITENNLGCLLIRQLKNMVPGK
ncbi:hypothetical protein D3C77_751590 [compost metagenome]